VVRDKYYFATRLGSLARDSEERRNHQEAPKKISEERSERGGKERTERERERERERSREPSRAKVHPLVHLARAYLHAVCAE